MPPLFFNWISFRFYPRISSRLIKDDLVPENFSTKFLATIKRKEIQERVRNRMVVSSPLLEDFERENSNDNLSFTDTNTDTDVDIGALIKIVDDLKINSKNQAVPFTPKALFELPWTIESILLFFNESFPSIVENIQIIDLRRKISAPVQWIIVIPISNQRLRISVGEEFIKSFKPRSSYSQLHLHGDLKTSPWILLELGLIYVNLMTPEEMERIDLAGLWSDSNTLKDEPFVPIEPKPFIKIDPNFVPKKILKIARKMEYEKKKQSTALLSKSTRKRIKHFKKNPVISLFPSSISIKSSLATKNITLPSKKIDKRLVLEGTFEEFPSTTSRNDDNYDDDLDIDNANVNLNVSSEQNDDILKELNGSPHMTSKVSRRRCQQSRRLRKALEKHSQELKSFTIEE